MYLLTPPTTAASLKGLREIVSTSSPTPPTSNPDPADRTLVQTNKQTNKKVNNNNNRSVNSDYIPWCLMLNWSSLEDIGLS